MVFILGFITGLYVGVLAMSVKFKKQLKQIKELKQVTPVTVDEESFSAESFVNTSDIKEK